MIQTGTFVSVCDNSGVRYAKCLKILGGSFRRYAFVGNKIILSVKSLRQKRKAFAKLKKGEIVTGLVIQTKSEIKTKLSVGLKFKMNYVVLLNSQNKPIGTRILAGIPLKIRYSKYMRLSAISLGLIK